MTKLMHASTPMLHQQCVSTADLSRLGAQTMAKFLACMLVSEENEAILTKWRIRYSRVLVVKGVEPVEGEGKS